MMNRPFSAPPPSPPPARLERVRALARLLDSSIPIPGTSRRIGLDPLIGLIPGFGDAAGMAMSGYILLEAARLGVSRAVLLRMAGNVAIEALVGVIPIVGDLFDAGFKSNVRNVRLLNGFLEEPGHATRASRGWLWGVLAALLLLVVGAGVVAAWMLGALLRAFGVG